nr:uncharacterized protein LOC126055766 [Helicoverpa armigera]
MAVYRTEDYATKTTDTLLQEVMKTFEDIPSKIKEYSQMRKDIKTFLEVQSDKGLRALFELCKRVTSLEAAADRTRAPSTVGPPGKDVHIIDKLENVETQLQLRLNKLEEKMVLCFDEQKTLRDDGGSDIIDKIVDKIDEAKAAINQATQGVKVVSRTQITLDEKLDGIAGDVAATKATLSEVAKQEKQPSEPRSYASVAAAKPGYRPALHSMAVTLEGNQETADEVLERVKKAVDARSTGLKINKVRKAKNQTVILGCDTKDELNKVKQTIESKGQGLIVTHIKNKNPLVILKNVFLQSDDEELTRALHIQNAEIFGNLSQEEIETTIKFKKRTKNPKTAHVIVQVSPVVWRRMTEAGALYLDLQRVRVEDQSPLIQCTKCLAFGHGRKFCTESADKCSHCGGPHLREKCADFIAGNEPRCCNCSHSRLQNTEHNAFSAECPIRKK